MTDQLLADRLAIGDVLANYAAAADERDRARYGACFTDDLLAVGFGSGEYRGRDTFLDYVFSALQKYSASQHLLGVVLADVDGDSARARTDVQAMHVLADSGRHLMLYGTYHSELRRQRDGWKISRHELAVRAISEH